MWRTYLLVYPFIAVYSAMVVPVFLPLARITGSIRAIYALAQLGCRTALRLGGVRLRVLHAGRAREHACCVFVANHISNVEAPALFSVLPRVAVIIKQSLARIPLLGRAMLAGGFIAVDRSAKQSRKRALDAAVNTLRSGVSLLVFPEGTRNASGKLLPFRPGPFQVAIRAGVPVVPITVHGATAIMPRGASHVRPGRVTLDFHPPVETDGLEVESAFELMRGVRAAMQAALERNPA